MSTSLVAVIGSSSATQEEQRIAEDVGRLIAKNGWILVNGGLGGVMEASAKGAFEAGGIVVEMSSCRWTTATLRRRLLSTIT